jgi:hypothetical protein
MVRNLPPADASAVLSEADKLLEPVSSQDGAAKALRLIRGEMRKKVGIE